RAQVQRGAERDGTSVATIVSVPAAPKTFDTLVAGGGATKSAAGSIAGFSIHPLTYLNAFLDYVSPVYGTTISGALAAPASGTAAAVIEVQALDCHGNPWRPGGD